MEIQGAIKEIKKTETVGANNFEKRDLIIVTEEQYPQTLSIQFVQKMCGVLDSFAEGEMVTVGLNLRGREWVNPKVVGSSPTIATKLLLPSHIIATSKK